MKRLLFLAVLAPALLLGQANPETFNIKSPGNKTKKKCGDYISIYNRLPVEVRYGVDVMDGMIYFYFPNRYYFDLLFDKNADGIAVDIVWRDQYKCYENNSFTKSWANRGHLMPPMYKKEMLQKLTTNEEGFLLIEYAELPPGFNPLNIECNLLVLQKKYLCGYHSFSKLDYNNWDLLEMGLYKDSLSAEDLQNRYKEISKVLRFTIPFEKSKTEFNAENIKPLYDSLELTDYNIKEIVIKAYTSVEGPLASNLEIQKGRANSIVAALQSYQLPEIISQVSARENWVEFLNDISDTGFEYLKKKSKEEIKHALTDTKLLNEIEPILKTHRKALVELRLQKRFSDEENDPDVLRRFFDQSIQNQNIQEALYIQQVIFEKVRNQNIPDDFIGQLEVPETALYGPLLNNLAIFNYEMNDIFLYENIANFERLLSILPDNPKIKYNLTALKIKAWTQGELITNQQDIKKSIDELEKSGIDKSLVRRLKVNYHIILTEHLHLKKDYRNKNKSLKEVYWLYSRLNLDDKDLLSLAKYLSIYSKFDWAESVLLNRITDFDADEELIFYYLKLTINNYKKTKQSQYRTFMLNAIDKSNERFCDIFLPKPQGGYTFQLLDNEFLKKTYCENCSY